MSTILGCPSCGTKNRVGSIPRGTPRCSRCKAALPWVVPADEASFAAESEASVPVFVGIAFILNGVGMAALGWEMRGVERDRAGA